MDEETSKLPYDEETEAIQAAIDAGLDVNAGDDSDLGRTALMCAAAEGGANTVRILLEAGARVDIASDDGWTALHHLAAAAEPDLDSLDLLLDAGADPNAGECSGETPVAIAAAFGNDDVLARLLAAGGTARMEHLRAALSAGVGHCAMQLLDIFPHATAADILAASEEPLGAGAREEMMREIERRCAMAMEAGLPRGEASQPRGHRM